MYVIFSYVPFLLPNLIGADVEGAKLEEPASDAPFFSHEGSATNRAPSPG